MMPSCIATTVPLFCHQLKYADAQAESLLKAVQIKPDLADAYFDLGYAAQQNKN